MADTKRSVAGLQTLLADNTAGDISPQDLRDMLVSAIGISGGIGIPTVASATQAIVAATPEKVELFTASQDHGVTAAHATHDMTVAISGLYHVTGNFSMYCDTNSIVFDFVVRVDGATTGVGAQRKVGTGADLGSASFGGMITLTAGEVVTLWVEGDKNTNLVLSRAQFMMHMIG